MKAGLNDALKEVKRQMRMMKKSTEKKNDHKTQPVHKDEPQIIVNIRKGSGKIMVSGTTVHGIDSKFMTEIKQNDFIILKNDNVEEKRKVILIISDKSCLLNEAFEDERTTEYFIENYEEVKEEVEEEPVKKKKIENDSKVYEVRVKRGPWTYKVDKVNKSGELSNEDLLNIRALRVRDKFCWM